MKRLVLIVSIFLTLFVQNAVLAADIHMGHQDGTEHMEFNHEHGAEVEVAEIDFSSSSDVSDLDCHHCCHCHGSPNHAVLSGKENIAPVTSSLFSVVAGFDLAPGILSTPFRPPIS